MTSFSIMGVEYEVSDKEYEVESILFHDTFESSFGRQTLYFVKWKNYPMSQCTWEPYQHLNKCTPALNDYRSNKIVAAEIYETAEYKELYDSLNTFTDQELLELSHRVRVIQQRNSINDKFLKAEIAYLSTVSLISRSSSLIRRIRYNLMIIAIVNKSQKQQDELNKWQKDMALVCGFNLTVLNDVDFEGPPESFYYSDECVPGKGVVIPNDPAVWCHCDVTCGGKKRKITECNFTYYQIAYNEFKRIRVPQGTPIFECKRKSTCDEMCIKRLIQHGPSKNLRLQIFRTDNNRGWGVKTLWSIKQGTYITKYTGEVITKSEADQRATHGENFKYLFDLGYNTEKNNSVYSIDATKYGNVSRFINHSCDFNLAKFAVWINSSDINIPTVALFASRDISAGEEITLEEQSKSEN